MIVAIVCRRRTAAVSSPRPIRRRSPTALPQAGEGGEGQRRHAVEAAIERTLAANGLETFRPPACGRQQTGLYRSS
jgi:hypothetical protein